MSKKHTVWILWGEDPQEDQLPLEYSFNTREELNAFLHGVQEADSWFGYDVIERDQMPSLTEFSNYNGEE